MSELLPPLAAAVGGTHSPLLSNPPLVHEQLVEVLDHHAARSPHAVAVRFEGQVYSYVQLAQRVGQAAVTLWHVWGVRTGDRVAYLGLNHADQIVLLFALARLGAVLVPLNHRLVMPEWQALLADCQPVAVLHDDFAATSADALAKAMGIAGHHLDALYQATSREALPALAGPASPVLLVYTSGTTGTPKGAVHTQANLLANMRAAATAQALVATDVIATALPLFHVGGLCIQTLPALYAGATVVLQSRFDPAALLACLENDRPSLTLQVPATLRALVTHPDWLKTDLSSLRAVWAGSSVIPPDLIAQLHQRGVPVCNVYGATETGPFSIALGPAQAFSHVGSCGWPAPGVEVKLVAVNGADAVGVGVAHVEAELPAQAETHVAPNDGANAIGEICLRAPNVVTRYWPDRPARDADGWFHTGDVARRAADGSYTVVGRAKDMIISGGENIYPAEIENLLSALPGVADCAVVGVPDAQWGEVAVAAVVGLPGAEPDEAALRHALAERLARYKLPRRYVWVDALPKTALGKVQKAVLRQQLQENRP